MKTVISILAQPICGLLIFLFITPQLVLGATEITGKVTEKRYDSVKVVFKAHDNASPTTGDRVDFTKSFKGSKYKAKAGHGVVTEIGNDFAWVKIIKKPVALKMTGVIQATGQATLYLMLKSEYKKFLENRDNNILIFIEQHAQNGNDDAQNMLGIIYIDGEGGVKPDIKKGLKWFRKAAAQGNAGSQYYLALSYLFEEDPPDYEKAARLFRQAAEQGHAKSQNNLGWLLKSGRGVKKNDVKVVMWYRKAAIQGLHESQAGLCSMYMSGGVGVSQDYAEALRWCRKAANSKIASSQVNMGMMYEFGLGITKNFAEAVKWYRMAAEQDTALAEFYLGLMYEKGKGVPESRSEAIKWYRKAGAQNHKDANTALKRLGAQ